MVFASVFSHFPINLYLLLNFHSIVQKVHWKSNRMRKLLATLKIVFRFITSKKTKTCFYFFFRKSCTFNFMDGIAQSVLYILCTSFLNNEVFNIWRCIKWVSGCLSMFISHQRKNVKGLCKDLKQNAFDCWSKSRANTKVILTDSIYVDMEYVCQEDMCILTCLYILMHSNYT